MTGQSDYTINEALSLSKDVAVCLEQHGDLTDLLPKLLSILLNHAMRLERDHHTKAKPYERTDERITYANGYKPKTINTRIGKVALNIPQTRDSAFYPSCLEKGLRSERALCSALAQMYVQGVSTRKVQAILNELCPGVDISSSQVSEANKELDAHLQQWRGRPLGSMPYMMLDARYEKIRMNNSVVSAAVLWAIGIDEKGQRTVLGVSTATSEHSIHWKQFLQNLVARGLHGLKFVTSDAHSGLLEALAHIFPTVPWQRCQFHLQQNALQHAPKVSMRAEITVGLRHVFNAPDLPEAQRILQNMIEKYETNHPKLADWLEDNVPQCFATYQLPQEHQKKLRTSNLIERLSRTIKKRTAVVKIFPDEASCLRLVSALLVEISEEWETGPKYLNMQANTS